MKPEMDRHRQPHRPGGAHREQHQAADADQRQQHQQCHVPAEQAPHVRHRVVHELHRQQADGAAIIRTPPPVPSSTGALSNG